MFHAAAQVFIDLFLAWPAHDTHGNPNLNFAAEFARQPLGFLDPIARVFGMLAMAEVQIVKMKIRVADSEVAARGGETPAFIMIGFLPP